MILGCLATLARRLFFQSLSKEKQEDMKRRGKGETETECNVESNKDKQRREFHKQEKKGEWKQI